LEEDAGENACFAGEAAAFSANEANPETRLCAACTKVLS